jgi:hypothetical protein
MYLMYAAGSAAKQAPLPWRADDTEPQELGGREAQEWPTAAATSPARQGDAGPGTSTTGPVLGK